MSSVIVCVSESHGNTAKVAAAMAEELGAEVVDPEDFAPDSFGSHDLVGFGSGIYFMRFHPRLRELIDRLPSAPGTRAFLFATSGSAELSVFGWTRPLRSALERRGADVVGTWTCRGWDTWLPLKVVGGLNRGHPDEHDLDSARRFVRGLTTSVG